MKKILLSATLIVFFAFQSSLFAQEGKSKAVVDADRNPIELSIAGNRVIYQNAPVGKKLEVYSVIGSKVTEFDIKSSSGEHTLNVTKGFYVLKLGDTVRKVVIR